MPGGLKADVANSLVIFALSLSVGWDYIRSSLYSYPELVDLYIDSIITEDVTCIQSIETTVVEGVTCTLRRVPMYSHLNLDYAHSIELIITRKSFTRLCVLQYA